MSALLRRVLTGIALLALSALANCSAAEVAGSEGGDDGTSGTSGTGGGVLSVVFTGENPLVLGPSEMKTVTAHVSVTEPSQTVRFALVDGPDTTDGPGSVADASLDLTEATTDGAGNAYVLLTAPSVPTHFVLRAMVGTVQAPLPVTVQAIGQAMLEVEPSYAGGRQVIEWVAEVYADGRTCADLEGNPPEGPYPAASVTVPKGQPIRIPDVPVGPKLAVTLRAGHFAGGCSGVDAVVEGQPNSVLVTVTNRPVQLDESEVVLRLGLSGQEDALAVGMESVIETAQAAVLGTAASDANALLDAMEEEAAAGGVCDRFGGVRETNGWDAALVTALGAAAATSIRDDLGGWLAAGVPSLARDDAFVGTLSADPVVLDRANLVLTTVAGFRARDAGFAESIPSSWTADAHDNVVLGATLTFNPSALLVLAARAPARMDEPSASTLAGAIALHGSRCDAVTTALVDRGQGVGQSCIGCNIACTRLLCENGVKRLVTRASNALAEEPAELRLAATGRAEVGEQAQLETLVGSWVGALSAANRASELAGDLSAD